MGRRVNEWKPPTSQNLENLAKCVVLIGYDLSFSAGPSGAHAAFTTTS